MKYEVLTVAVRTIPWRDRVTMVGWKGCMRSGAAEKKPDEAYHFVSTSTTMSSACRCPPLCGVSHGDGSKRTISEYTITPPPSPASCRPLFILDILTCYYIEPTPHVPRPTPPRPTLPHPTLPLYQCIRKL